MKSLIFAVILGFAALSQACRCPMLADPAYCRTQYLMLVKLTQLNIDFEHAHRTYNFELFSDISLPAKFTTNFTIIETGFDGGSCMLNLDINKFYLLGGQVEEKEHKLWCTTCNSYWQEWNFVPGTFRSDAELDRIRKQCQEFRANPDENK